MQTVTIPSSVIQGHSNLPVISQLLRLPAPPPSQADKAASAAQTRAYTGGSEAAMLAASHHPPQQESSQLSSSDRHYTRRLQDALAQQRPGFLSLSPTGDMNDGKNCTEKTKLPFTDHVAAKDTVTTQENENMEEDEMPNDDHSVEDKDRLEEIEAVEDKPEDMEQGEAMEDSLAPGHHNNNIETNKDCDLSEKVALLEATMDAYKRESEQKILKLTAENQQATREIERLQNQLKQQAEMNVKNSLIGLKLDPSQLNPLLLGAGILPPSLAAPGAVSPPAPGTGAGPNNPSQLLDLIERAKVLQQGGGGVGGTGDSDAGQINRFPPKSGSEDENVVVTPPVTTSLVGGVQLRTSGLFSPPPADQLLLRWRQNLPLPPNIQEPGKERASEVSFSRSPSPRPKTSSPRGSDLDSDRIGGGVSPPTYPESSDHQHRLGGIGLPLNPVATAATTTTSSSSNGTTPSLLSASQPDLIGARDGTSPTSHLSAGGNSRMSENNSPAGKSDIADNMSAHSSSAASPLFLSSVAGETASSLTSMIATAAQLPSSAVMSPLSPFNGGGVHPHGPPGLGGISVPSLLSSASRIPKSDPMEGRLQDMLRFNMEKHAGQAIDTLTTSRRVRELLSVHNIGQRLFAKYVLGLSQGTVSELLSKPKSWDKLTEKGRDSYRKMHAWAYDDQAILLLKSLIPRKGELVRPLSQSPLMIKPEGSPVGDDRLRQDLSRPSSTLNDPMGQQKKVEEAMARLYKEELARMMGSNGKALLEAASNPLMKAGGFPLPLFSGLEDLASFPRPPPGDLHQALSLYQEELSKLQQTAFSNALKDQEKAGLNAGGSPRSHNNNNNNNNNDDGEDSIEAIRDDVKNEAGSPLGRHDHGLKLGKPFLSASKEESGTSPLQRMASITNALVTHPPPVSFPGSSPRPLKNALPPITQQQFDRYAHVNTDDTVRRIKEILSQYSISQRLFGEAVLGLSQGSVSDLLARPKPWHMLTQKGREPFIRMKIFLEDEGAVHRLVASQYKIAPDKLMRTGYNNPLGLPGAGARPPLNLPGAIGGGKLAPDHSSALLGHPHLNRGAPHPLVAAHHPHHLGLPPNSVAGQLPPHFDPLQLLASANRFAAPPLSSPQQQLQAAAALAPTFPASVAASALIGGGNSVSAVESAAKLGASGNLSSAAGRLTGLLSPPGSGATPNAGAGAPGLIPNSALFEVAALTSELDTQQVTTKVKEILLANNVGQKLFGEAVLGLSQGSVSELLSKPKPWHMLSIKGREPFVRMQLWLNDPNNIDKLTAIKSEQREVSKRRYSGSDDRSMSPVEVQYDSNSNDVFDVCSKRPRTSSTTAMDEGQQQEALLLAFTLDPLPSEQALEFIGRELGLETSLVAAWFHNHRQRLKQLHGESAVDALLASVKQSQQTVNSNGAGGAASGSFDPQKFRLLLLNRRKLMVGGGDLLPVTSSVLPVTTPAAVSTVASGTTAPAATVFPPHLPFLPPGFNPFAAAGNNGAPATSPAGPLGAFTGLLTAAGRQAGVNNGPGSGLDLSLKIDLLHQQHQAKSESADHEDDENPPARHQSGPNEAAENRTESDQPDGGEASNAESDDVNMASDDAAKRGLADSADTISSAAANSVSRSRRKPAAPQAWAAREQAIHNDDDQPPNADASGIDSTSATSSSDAAGQSATADGDNDDESSPTLPINGVCVRNVINDSSYDKTQVS